MRSGLDIILPWPPSENGAYRVTPIISQSILTRIIRCFEERGLEKARRLAMGLIRGGWSLDKSGRAYTDTVRTLIGPREPMFGRVQIIHDWTPPDRRKRDMYNHHKVLHDALTKARVWGDDSLIVQGGDYWHEPKEPGAVRIQVEEL